MQQNINDMSSQQKQADNTGQMIGAGLLGAGAAVLASCWTNGGSCKLGYALVAAGALSLIAAGNNGDKGGQNAGTAAQVTAPAEHTNSTNLTSGGGNALSPEAQAKLAQLKKQGIGVNLANGNITTPDGTFNARSVTSADGMAAAGLNPADFSKVQAAAQKAEDLAKAKLAAAGGSGGGMDGGDSINIGGGAGNGGETAGGAGAIGLNGQARKVAGATTGTGGLSLVGGGGMNGANGCTFFCSTRTAYQEHVRRGHLDPNLK
jgi:hypothetical protein